MKEIKNLESAITNKDLKHLKRMYLKLKISEENLIEFFCDFENADFVGNSWLILTDISLMRKGLEKVIIDVINKTKE